MPFIDAAIGVRLVYYLGIANIIGLVLVLLSCRCVLGTRLNERLWKSNLYKKFYNFHCYYWWFFIASVALHSIIAVIVFGANF